MSVIVRIPTPLRTLTSGKAEVKVEGATVGEVLRQLDSQFKGFGDRVFDEEKRVRRFINVFVNEDNIRDKNNLDTTVRDGDTVSILPSIAGGGRGHNARDYKGA
jgi:MoaD family protein